MIIIMMVCDDDDGMNMIIRSPCRFLLRERMHLHIWHSFNLLAKAFLMAAMTENSSLSMFKALQDAVQMGAYRSAVALAETILIQSPSTRTPLKKQMRTAGIC